MCIIMYSKCMSCRLYDSLICGRYCRGYSHFEPINRRLYHYVDSQKQICGPVEAYLLPFYGVNQESYVWANGMRDWTQVSRISELCFIPSVSTTRIQDSVNIHTRINTVLTVLGNIPLGTKIVYLLYLLVLFFIALGHIIVIITSLWSTLYLATLDFCALFGIIGLLFVVNLISIWGLWQLFRYHKKAGFWLAILSFCIHLMILCAMVGWLSFDYEGTFAHPTTNDTYRDHIYPIGGASLGIMFSYIFVSILWFSLYFKRKGAAFVSCLNNDRLIFSLGFLRLLPILFLLAFSVLWTLGSIF